MNKPKKIKGRKKFPKTPIPVNDIGRYRVGVAVDHSEIYFWDSKSSMWNFSFKLAKR